MARLWAFYISAILTMPLLASLLLRGNARFALFVCALVLSAVVLQSTRPHPHYAAPATCLVFFLAAQGCRRLQLCRIAGRPVGRFFVRMLPLLLVFSASTRAVQWNLSTMYSWKLHKARIERDVSETDELDLVLVRYNRRHILHHEWVYNRADIDAAPIVWARELSPEKNRRLLEYFAGRRVWLLEADAPTPLLVPYAP